MKNVISNFIFILILALATYAFSTATSSSKQPAPAAVETSKTTETTVFEGVVKKMDEGTALFTEKEVYPLLGGDFGMIVGKEVSIVGKVIKEGNVEKIVVARVQFKKQ